MVARITGGAIAGWLLGVAPLVVVNALSLIQGAVDPSATAVAGAVALVAGIAQGGIAAGLIGGRRGGAISGALAGALFTASLVGLEFWLQAHGALPVLVAEHPVRTVGALVFIGALLAGVALGVAALLGMRAARAEAHALEAFAAARSEVARSRPLDPGASQFRPASSRMTPPRAAEREWPPSPRPAPPGSAPRPAGRAGAAGAYHDERANQGYDEDRWSRAPGHR